MNAKDFEYIHFANYKDFPNWSVQYVVEERLGFTNKFPMAKIGSFLTKSKEQIEIQDDVEYKQVTVKINNGGVVARNDGQLKKGSEIGTKRQTIVHAGQFIVSKIDARNGAFGIIPNDLEGAIVTNDFPVFDVDNTKVLPQFMVLISTTPQFVEFARKCSSGTTNRKRIDINAFLEQVIPLPSLEEQGQMLKTYNQRQGKAKELMDEVSKLNIKKNTYLQNTLKIVNVLPKNRNKSKPFLHFLNRKDIERWDEWNVNSSVKSSIYPNVKLGHLIKMQSGKFLPQNRIKEGNYCVYGGNGLIGKHNEYSFEGKKIIIGRVGEKCGNVHLVSGRYWITDNALKVDKVSEDVTYEYLDIALRVIEMGRFRVMSAQPSISQSIILNLTIPVPCLKMQNEIVKKINEYRNKELCLIADVEECKRRALTDFKRAIFE